MNIIKIGSRDSKLAVIQADSVMRTLHLSGQETQLVTMKTTGDKILDRTLDKIGGKGLFVKELDAALREGRADFTVHSLKDMPMETPEDLPLVAVSAREDARDVLVLPEGVLEIDFTKPIGCSSARRRIQLQALFPQARIEPIRGNVQTRLRKLDEGQFGALVLAAAGLHRLGLSARISRYFTTAEILPAAGQAIIAVQARKDTDCSCLAAYHDPIAWDCMLAERAFVRTLDGGCSSPVAAYAERQDNTLHLQGMYVNAEETIVRFGAASGAAEDAEAIGRTLAEQLRKGADT